MHYEEYARLQHGVSPSHPRVNNNEREPARQLQVGPGRLAGEWMPEQRKSATVLAEQVKVEDGVSSQATGTLHH